MITAAEFDSIKRSEDAQIESAIDAAIRDAAKFKRVAVTIAARWDHDSIERVLTGYRLTGWAAEITADSREGDFITLVPR